MVGSSSSGPGPGVAPLPPSPAPAAPSAGEPSNTALSGGVTAAAEAPAISPASHAGHPGSIKTNKPVSEIRGVASLVADNEGRVAQWTPPEARGYGNQSGTGPDSNALPPSGTAASDRGAGRAMNAAAEQIKKAEAAKQAALSSPNAKLNTGIKAEMERRMDAGTATDQDRLAHAQSNRALGLPDSHIGRH